MSWDWSSFIGDPECIKWSRRDLESLEAALKLLPGRTAAVQAGGNVGLFPKRLAEEFTTVYTFEPDRTLFDAMVHNAPATNIVMMQAALGYERKPVRLECTRRDGSKKPVHAGLTHVAGDGVVPILRIDDLALPDCDLIYLDVEGWELQALLGAHFTIRTCRPVIAVEINKGIQYAGSSPEELRQLICGYGYSLAIKMHSDEIYTPGV